MIDNFELIKPLFYFNEANNIFFHCQVIIRKKDHKEEKIKERIIKTYLIQSREHLDKVKDEIVLLCEHYGARAYINVAGKDFDDMQKLMLMKLARNVTENITQNPGRLLNSVAGEVKSRTPKWVIDIDDLSVMNAVADKLFELYADSWKKKGSDTSVEALKEVGYRYIYAQIPTKQGAHLIVRPFNLQAFHEEFPDVSVHKNNPTLLYYPKSLNIKNNL